MNGLIKRLRELGYNQNDANRLYAMHLSNGTLDLLECYIDKMEQAEQKNPK